MLFRYLGDMFHRHFSVAWRKIAAVVIAAMCLLQLCAAQSIDVCADPGCATAGDTCVTKKDCCVGFHLCNDGVCMPEPCFGGAAGNQGCRCAADVDCRGNLQCALNGPNKGTCQVCSAPRS